MGKSMMNSSRMDFLGTGSVANSFQFQGGQLKTIASKKDYLSPKGGHNTLLNNYLESSIQREGKGGLDMHTASIKAYNMKSFDNVRSKVLKSSVSHQSLMNSQRDFLRNEDSRDGLSLSINHHPLKDMTIQLQAGSVTQRMPANPPENLNDQISKHKLRIQKGSD